MNPPSSGGETPRPLSSLHNGGQELRWILEHANRHSLGADETEALIRQRAQGIPLAYVLEEWDFLGRTYRVTPDTLIPRPETESLVERCLKDCPDADEVRRVAEVGAGSGVIAVSLALARPAWSVVASDISKPALEVARENALAHGATNVRLLLHDGIPPGEFDMLVSNPPYIDPRDDAVESSVRLHEPGSALFSPGGTGLTRRLMAEASDRGIGELWFEFGLGQGGELAAYGNGLGYASALHPDLSGRERVLHLWR